jgi:Cysteine-rich secretory protein family
MYNDEIGFFPLPYGQAQPDMSNFESWGHFSQIVWQSTTSVGCATVNCPNGLANTGAGVAPWFTVCNYSPPGMPLSPLPWAPSKRVLTIICRKLRG